MTPAPMRTTSTSVGSGSGAKHAQQPGGSLGFDKFLGASTFLMEAPRAASNCEALMESSKLADNRFSSDMENDAAMTT